MLKAGFGEQPMGKDKNFGVIFQVQKAVTSVEDDECSDGPAVSKTVEKCGLYKGTCS
jgi:hypothetical protein